jgi:hypothetical protein
VKAGDPTYRGPHPLLHSTRKNVVGDIPTSRRVIPNVFVDWTYLRQVDRFKVAPGGIISDFMHSDSETFPAINQISQSGRIVVVASATVGGANNDLPSPYNAGPSLLTWRNGYRSYTVPVHPRCLIDLTAVIPMNDHSLYFVNEHSTEDVPMGKCSQEAISFVLPHIVSDEDSESTLKHYTVNDVQFDPRK